MKRFSGLHICHSDKQRTCSLSTKGLYLFMRKLWRSQRLSLRCSLWHLKIKPRNRTFSITVILSRKVQDPKNKSKMSIIFCFHFAKPCCDFFFFFEWPTFCDLLFAWRVISMIPKNFRSSWLQCWVYILETCPRVLRKEVCFKPIKITWYSILCY